MYREDSRCGGCDKQNKKNESDESVGILWTTLQRLQTIRKRSWCTQRVSGVVLIANKRKQKKTKSVCLFVTNLKSTYGRTFRIPTISLQQKPLPLQNQNVMDELRESKNEWTLPSPSSKPWLTSLRAWLDKQREWVGNYKGRDRSVSSPEHATGSRCMSRTVSTSHRGHVKAHPATRALALVRAVFDQFMGS